VVTAAPQLIPGGATAHPVNQKLRHQFAKSRPHTPIEPGIPRLPTLLDMH